MNFNFTLRISAYGIVIALLCSMVMSEGMNCVVRTGKRVAMGGYSMNKQYRRECTMQLKPNNEEEGIGEERLMKTDVEKRRLADSQRIGEKIVGFNVVCTAAWIACGVKGHLYVPYDLFAAGFHLFFGYQFYNTIFQSKVIEIVYDRYMQNECKDYIQDRRCRAITRITHPDKKMREETVALEHTILGFALNKIPSYVLDYPKAFLLSNNKKILLSMFMVLVPSTLINLCFSGYVRGRRSPAATISQVQYLATLKQKYPEIVEEIRKSKSISLW